MLRTGEESSITDTFLAPESRFECPICLAWLRDPILTTCGHRFCRACMESWLRRENPCCPIDNTPLRKDVDIFPDNFTRREISQQKSKCLYLSRGCLEELSPLDVEMHLAICKFRPPVATLPENEKIRCSFVQVGCEDKFEDEPELQRHIEQEIQKHLSLLSQAYSKFALNNGVGASSSRIAHEANFWDPPSKSDEAAPLPVTDVNGRLRALFEKMVLLEQKTREQDIILANMSEQISSLNVTMSKHHLRYCNGTYFWYLSDFREKIKAMSHDLHIMHYSPGFFTTPNGYKFCVRLNISPKDPNYVAILIHAMKTEHDNALEWPFSGRLSITIVHPSDSGHNMKETMMTRPELEAFRRPLQDLNPKGFGYREFALVNDLLGLGYIDGSGQLLVKIQAQSI